MGGKEDGREGGAKLHSMNVYLFTPPSPPPSLPPQATLEVAEMVLCGLVNKEIASLIKKSGARAIGIAGRDDGLLVGTKVREGGREGGREEGRATFMKVC